MIQAKAQLNSLRIAPRKVRLVADLIKGRDAQEAQTQLLVYAKRASNPMLKLLKSAIANARHNVKIGTSDALHIRDVRVDEGRVYKRFMPRARGRASMIKKRTSHITLILETREK